MLAEVVPLELIIGTLNCYLELFTRASNYLEASNRKLRNTGRGFASKVEGFDLMCIWRLKSAASSELVMALNLFIYYFFLFPTSDRLFRL